MHRNILEELNSIFMQICSSFLLYQYGHVSHDILKRTVLNGPVMLVSLVKLMLTILDLLLGELICHFCFFFFFDADLTILSPARVKAFGAVFK